MKADEAKRMAINSVSDQIEGVKKEIKKAAEAGQLSVNLENLKPATKEWLIENGYKVEHHSTSNWSTDSVSW